MSRDDCSSGIAVLSFLTGAVVGAAVAMLVSPRTGKEVREMLAGYGNDIRNRATDFTDDFKEQSESVFEQGKDLMEKGRELMQKGTEMMNIGKDYLEEKKQTIVSALEAGKDAMHREKEALSAAGEKKDKKKTE